MLLKDNFRPRKTTFGSRGRYFANYSGGRRIQGYQRQEILQKITASNDIREIAKLLENAQGGVFNVKSL